jgi:dTDP-4-amino-4,6-dideoxygalactose transaminase
MRDINLAIFTRRPAFEKALHVGAPYVEPETQKRFHTYMDGAFERAYLTNNGPLVQELEKELAHLHSVRYCAATCNATLAQLFILSALDLRGDVLLPSFTFIATVHACLWQNLRPVFCDIRPDTLMIDPADAARRITSQTSAIIGVHLFGNICEVESLTELARRHRLKLMFDAAHAFGCSLGSASVGGFGDAEFFSFHSTKFFGTFEGGAMTTNDAELDRKIRYLRNFGFRTYDDVGFLGLNGKMSEASAAMGLASLPEIPRRIERLEATHRAYRDGLSRVPGITVLPAGREGRSNFHYLVTLIDEARFGVSRDILYRVLWQENVLVRRYFYPGCHAMSFYRSSEPNDYPHLPVTEDICKRILCFPTNLNNPKGDIDSIVGLLQRIHDNAERVAIWAESQP